MKNWLNQCHFGDCIETMRQMPDGIAQTCVTSPPYFGLRSYLPGVVQLRDDLSQEKREQIIRDLAAIGVFQTSLTTD